MQKNKELQDLFTKYNNLSEEQLMQLLGLIVKQEKEKMKLSFPVRLEINFDEVGKNYAGGDSSLEFNDEEKTYEYAIRLNGQEWYKQYLANRGKVYQNGNMTFDASLDSLYNLIARLCHEMRHAYQNEVTSVKKDITDINALTWLKEALVITDNDFYRKNYGNMSREIDAFNYQYQEALEYIKTYTSIKLDNPDFFETLQKTLEKNQQTNVKPLDELTIDVDGEQIKNTDYFNEHMTAAFQEQGITADMLKNSILRYEYNPDGTKKSLEQLMQDKQSMIDRIDKTLSNYQRQVERIERIYDSIIQNDSKLQLQVHQSKETIEQHIGYSREENERSITEKQKQVLKDYSSKQIGHRVITSTYDMEKGSELIDTVGEIETEDGTYKISDKQQVYGGELQIRRKELTKFNKNTGENEQYVYQKDKNDNEMFYRIVEGKLTFKITKNTRGTTMEQYDNGQLVNTYEYDENGEALIGIEGIEKIDEDYVENYFDINVPFFEAENSDLQMQQKMVDTKKLGKETLDLQSKAEKMQEVEQTLEEHMSERQPQAQQQQTDTFEINEFGEIIRPNTDKRSFKERMRVEIDTNDYAQEILTQVEQDLENGTLDNGKKKKKEDYNPEKGDDDYIL